jgi:peptide chain release factor 1
MRSLALDEYNSLTATLTQCLESTFPSLLVPPSTTSHLSALMEMKSGVGGSESSLFLSDLLRMYQRLANVNRWKAQVVAQNDNDGGGTKDAIIEIKGDGVYDALRWESGVHRVQRVPATESSGRVHTSTVSIVVCAMLYRLRIVTEDSFVGFTTCRGNRHPGRRAFFDERYQARGHASSWCWRPSKYNYKRLDASS